MPAGEPRRAFEAVALEAFALAEPLGDYKRASQACQIAVLAMLRYEGPATLTSPVAARWAERANQYAAADTAGRARADIALFTSRALAPQFGGTRALATRALELARRLDDPDTLFFAAAYLITGPLLPFADRLALAEEFTIRPSQGASSFIQGIVLGAGGALLLASGQRARAEQVLAQAKRWRRERKTPLLSAFSIWHEARLAFVDGRLEEGVEASKLVLELSEERGSPVFGQTLARGISEFTLLHLGRTEEAIAA